MKQCGDERDVGEVEVEGMYQAKSAGNQVGGGRRGGPPQSCSECPETHIGFRKL